MEAGGVKLRAALRKTLQASRKCWQRRERTGLREKNSPHYCAVARLRGCAVALKKRHQMFQVFSSAAPVTLWERLARVNILFETFLQQPMRLVFES
jgi:hypothetical protein